MGQSDHIKSFRPKRNVFKSDYNTIKEELLQHDWLTHGLLNRYGLISCLRDFGLGISIYSRN